MITSSDSPKVDGLKAASWTKEMKSLDPNKGKKVVTYRCSFNLCDHGCFSSGTFLRYRNESAQTILCHDVDSTFLLVGMLPYEGLKIRFEIFWRREADEEHTEQLPPFKYAFPARKKHKLSKRTDETFILRTCWDYRSTASSIDNISRLEVLRVWGLH